MFDRISAFEQSNCLPILNTATSDTSANNVQSLTAYTSKGNSKEVTL